MVSLLDNNPKNGAFATTTDAHGKVYHRGYDIWACFDGMQLHEVW